MIKEFNQEQPASIDNMKFNSLTLERNSVLVVRVDRDHYDVDVL